MAPLQRALKSIASQLSEELTCRVLIWSNSTNNVVGPSLRNAPHERFAGTLTTHDLVGRRVGVPGVVESKIQLRDLGAKSIRRSIWHHKARQQLFECLRIGEPRGLKDRDLSLEAFELLVYKPNTAELG